MAKSITKGMTWRWEKVEDYQRRDEQDKCKGCKWQGVYSSQVDEDFKLLIKELNRVGLKTHASCQGGCHSGVTSPTAYIYFELKGVQVFVGNGSVRLSWVRDLRCLKESNI